MMNTDNQKLFIYNPVRTQKRKDLHEVNNQLTLDVYNSLDDFQTYLNFIEQFDHNDDFVQIAISFLCLYFRISKKENITKEELFEYIEIELSHYDVKTLNLVFLQITRMLMNQVITFNEIEEEGVGND